MSEKEYNPDLVVKGQRIIRNYLSRKRYNHWNRIISLYNHCDEAKNARKRFKLWNELIETEKTYMKCLFFAVQRYKVKLLEDHVIDSNDAQMLFGTIEEIKNMSKELYSNLVKDVLPSTSASELGKTFKTMLPYMKLYIPYVVNYEKCITVYNKIKNTKKFIAIEENYAKDPFRVTKLGLTDLLIQPIQRLPRYKLLFDQIVDLTPSDFMGYDDLVYVKDEIEKLCSTVNEKKKHAESLHELVRIHKQIRDCPNLYGRWFLKEGFALNYVTGNPLQISDENDASLPVSWGAPCYWFLLNDSIILTSRLKKEKYQYIGAILLQNIVSVNQFPNKPGSFALRISQKVKRDSDDRNICELYVLTLSEEDGDQWLSAVRTAINRDSCKFTRDPSETVLEVTQALFEKGEEALSTLPRRTRSSFSGSLGGSSPNDSPNSEPHSNNNGAAADIASPSPVTSPRSSILRTVSTKILLRPNNQSPKAPPKAKDDLVITRQDSGTHSPSIQPSTSSESVDSPSSETDQGNLRRSSIKRGISKFFQRKDTM